MSVRYIFPLSNNNYLNELPPAVINAAANKQLISPSAARQQKAPEPPVQEPVPQAVIPVPETPQQTAPSKPEMPAKPEIPEYQPAASPEMRPRIGRIIAASVIAAVLAGSGMFLLFRNKGGSSSSDDEAIVTDASGYMEITSAEDTVSPTEEDTVSPTEKDTGILPGEFTEEATDAPSEEASAPTEAVTDEITGGDFASLSPDVGECLGALQMTAQSAEYTGTDSAGTKLGLIAETLDSLIGKNIVSWRTDDLSGGYISFRLNNGYECTWGIADPDGDNYQKFSAASYGDAGNRAGLDDGSLKLYFCGSGCYILTRDDISSINAGIG